MAQNRPTIPYDDRIRLPRIPPRHCHPSTSDASLGVIPMRDRFKSFIVISLIITLALSGLAFQKAESQGNHISGQQVQQAIDREAAVVKNAEARREDCENNNELRKGLSIGVKIGEKNTPLLLRLLPQLNVKEVAVLSARENGRQLKAYAPINCEAYALWAVPKPSQKKVTLEVQQHEIDGLVHQLQVTETKEHAARLVTVTQRCELTKLVLANTTKPALRAKLTTSYRGCEKQLSVIKGA